MSFLQASLDLFTGARAGHLIGDHYVNHGGMRDGKSMSGPKLWEEAEIARESQGLEGKFNLVSAEQRLLHKVAEDITHYVPMGARIVELGPGTVSAFTKKTLPLIRALHTKEITLVDGSAVFLRNILTSGMISGMRVRSVEDDFFEGGHLYDDAEEPGLVCTFGSTISNIIAPCSDELPENALIAALASFSQAINEGWLLIGFDSNQDGSGLKAYYEAASLFFLSIFYRMRAELPVSKGFDPEAFAYEADWNPRSGQMAHMAIVKRDMKFSLGTRNIFLYKGQRLHMKNAYKYRPEFFERCCQRVGLQVSQSWADSSPARIYLLKKLPHLIVRAAQPPLLRWAS